MPAGCCKACAIHPGAQRFKRVATLPLTREWSRQRGSTAGHDCARLAWHVSVQYSRVWGKGA